MVGNISDNKSNVLERYSTGPNFFEKILFWPTFLLNRRTEMYVLGLQKSVSVKKQTAHPILKLNFDTKYKFTLPPYGEK